MMWWVENALILLASLGVTSLIWWRIGQDVPDVDNELKYLRLHREYTADWDAQDAEDDYNAIWRRAECEAEQ